MCAIILWLPLPPPHARRSAQDSRPTDVGPARRLAVTIMPPAPVAIKPPKGRDRLGYRRRGRGVGGGRSLVVDFAAPRAWTDTARRSCATRGRPADADRNRRSPQSRRPAPTALLRRASAQPLGGHEAGLAGAGSPPSIVDLCCPSIVIESVPMSNGESFVRVRSKASKILSANPSGTNPSKVANRESFRPIS
jgi:hypothetical protein